MRKILSIILIIATLLSLLPALAVFSGASETDDVDSTTVRQYLPDDVFCSITGGQSSVSSGDPMRWNKMSGVSLGSETDPHDSTNTTTKAFLTGTSGVMRKILGFPSDREFVMEISFLVTEPAVGTSLSTLTAKMFGEVVISLTRKSDTEYTYTIGSDTGTIPTGSWLRYVCHVVPGTNGIVSSDSIVRSVLYGSFQDDTDGAVTEYKKDYSGVTKSPEFRFDMAAAAESETGILIDDLYIYTPGDFGASSVTFTKDEEELFNNYLLDGKVTIDLYHRLDISRFNTASLKLYNDAGGEVPIGGIAFNPLKPGRLVLDFASHPLDANTTYTLVFPENTIDLSGRRMEENEITFRTRGEAGEWPERVEIIDVPAGGYVMPDPYNTGYRCERDELITLETKYPELTSDKIITEEIARKYNYEFSHFVLEGQILYITATSPVYIHDALFIDSGISNYRTGLNKNGKPFTYSVRLTVAWCEGVGGNSFFFQGANITALHCYVYDVKADHVKANSGQIFAYNYFRDGGTRSPGAHADVVQFSGAVGSVMNDVRFFGNRFDAPGMGYEHVSNCIFFFSPESECVGFSNVQAIGNWFNGGVYTLIVAPEVDCNQGVYLTIKDNKYGYGHSSKKSYNISYTEEKMIQTGSVYENNGYVTTMDAGSIVYYDADGRRVYDVSDISLQGSILVNLANYLTEARSYSIRVRVLDRFGNAVSTVEKNGEIRRYTPYKEYSTADNQKVTGQWKDADGVLHDIVELINMPDLPRDVPETVTLEHLPADMTGCRIEVTVCDTTDEETVIRTGALGAKVVENHKMPGATYTKNGYYSSDIYSANWSGKTASDILSEGAIAWSTENPSATASVDATGVLTLTGVTREHLSLPLNDLSAGPVRLAFDLYRNGDGTDQEFKMLFGERTVFSITPAGAVKVGADSGVAYAGWNTIEVIFLPFDATGRLCTHSSDSVARNEVYVRITEQGSQFPSPGISESSLNGYLKNVSFGTHVFYSTAADQTKLGVSDASSSLKLANLTASNLSVSEWLFELDIQVGESSQTVYIPREAPVYELPTHASSDAYIVVSETDRITRIMTPGASLTVTDDLTLRGAQQDNSRLAGATLSLGTTMALNMKVDPGSLVAEAPGKVYVVANNTAYQGTFGMAIGDDGYITSTLTDLRAANMGVDLSLYIISEIDGTTYVSTSPTIYSPMLYATRMYKKSDTSANVKTLLSAMLGYGAAAEEGMYETNIIREAAVASGITIPTALPSDTTYTSSSITDTDIATLGEIADVGARLTNGIDIVLALKGDSVGKYTSLVVSDGTSAVTCPVIDDTFIIRGIHAGMVQTPLSITFCGADEAENRSVHFAIGNFLARRLSYTEEVPLVTATILYMSEVAEYAKHMS